MNILIFIHFIQRLIILPYLFIIATWTLIISKDINFEDMKKIGDEQAHEDNKKYVADKVNKDILTWSENVPYILKLIPTIIILYFYFR